MSSGKACLSWKAGAKVGTLPVQSKFRDCFFSFFLKGKGKALRISKVKGNFFFTGGKEREKGERGDTLLY